MKDLFKTVKTKGTLNAGQLLFIVAVLTAGCSSVAAQSSTARPRDPVTSISADKSSPDSESQTNSMAEEMRVKREIKYAEKEHKQNLERARAVSDLGQDLAACLKEKDSLDREDIKKLDKLEKLAKRIRSEAGGSEDEVTIDKRPGDLVEALSCIAKVSASLNDKVQETPRQVISTSIIDKANVLLELIRIVRSLSHKV